jgi:hypothetical protein
MSNFSDDTIALVAAIGAKAHTVGAIEADRDLYRKWYYDEEKKISGLREEVQRLKNLLLDNNIEY